MADVPDLASVLRTLASLAPSTQQSQPYNPQAPLQNANTEPDRSTTPDYEPPPAQVQAHLPQYGQQSNPQQWNQRTEYAQPAPMLPKQQPTAIIDPTTITEWSAGLRCVMKTVAKNETIVHEIRRMIKIQHEHEEQWWNGRKALVEKLAARKEGKKKLDEVLRAVGGLVGAGSSIDSPEALASELATFDMKVYKAQLQMVREMTSRLRGLGVPFFGTRTDLVRPIGKDAPPGVDAFADQKGVIDEVELVKLQRKILAVLEDISGD